MLSESEIKNRILKLKRLYDEVGPLLPKDGWFSTKSGISWRVEFVGQHIDELLNNTPSFIVSRGQAEQMRYCNVVYRMLLEAKRNRK